MSNKVEFKPTEIGFIPNDWNTTELKHVLTIGHGKPQFAIEDENGKYPILATGGILGYTNHYLYNKPSVLIGRKGTIDKPQYMDTPFWTVDTLFYTHINEKFNPKFIYYKFHLIDWKRHSEASGVPSLSSNIINEQIISHPQLAEQQKIAQALTNADNYISALEKLIEKKKMIKEGLLSELFKKESEWNAYAIEDLVLPNNGLVRGPFGGALKKEDFVNEGYKVYEQKNAIYKNSELGTYYINKNKYRKLIRFAVRSDDLILSCSGTIGKIYRIPSNFEKGVINQALLIIRINQTIIDLDYFEHYFNRQDFQTSIIDDTQGGAMKNLVGMPIFKKKIIYCPDMNKQKEISKILNNLDLDIDSIDKKLDKAKKLKQGMMQKLLTGEIRLA
ncbi:MAG: restriction endonuclease subunit S [Acinetobacter sp.]|uniref:restriction endonuclease subunit S n=1 Tax=Acinetobacter sp. TaxID=472 RepID=UPI0026DEDB4E|nr:restriction endonuclease subunit S [Acinetobacter sp.]MDO5543569.1 restriction endonuclease subunit S [Acinetobacter sp.]